MAAFKCTCDYATDARAMVKDDIGILPVCSQLHMAVPGGLRNGVSPNASRWRARTYTPAGIVCNISGLRQEGAMRIN